MLLVFWKATSSPLNTIFLALFTVCESVMIGWQLPAYSPDTILKALIITTFVFLGLTLFTFQVRPDYDASLSVCPELTFLSLDCRPSTISSRGTPT
jgi:hypothetical protein